MCLDGDVSLRFHVAGWKRLVLTPGRLRKPKEFIPSDSVSNHIAHSIPLFKIQTSHHEPSNIGGVRKDCRRVTITRDGGGVVRDVNYYRRRSHMRLDSRHAPVV